MNVLIEKKDRIFTVIINRPEVKNAVDGKTANELADTFRSFEADTESDVAVLCGSGDCFCAGADLKSVAQASESPSHHLEETGDGPMGPSRMVLSKPVIAAISGYAVAGGLELALWCDLRVMEKSAVLGVFCRRWGVPLIDGGTIRLPRMIGLSRALDLILTGRPVESDEALAIGLVNRVVENGCARKEAEKLASELIKFPQTCLRHDRLSAYEQFSMDLPDAILNEFRHGLKVINSNETINGAKRFSQGKGRHGSFED